MKLAMVLRGDFCGLGTLSRVFRDCFQPYRSLSLSFRDERHDDKFFCTDANRIVPRRQQITKADAEWPIDGAEALIGLETFYSPEVTFAARRAGIKIILVPMLEQLPMGGVGNSFVTHAICPNELCRREVEITLSMRGAKVSVLPPPIDTDKIPFRLREKARTFVHFAKQGDRDGTRETIEAWQYVKSDARLIVYKHGEPTLSTDQRIEVRDRRSVDYWDDYAPGDVLIHCHRYAGYACPPHEALAAGMPVVTTRFWPFCDGPIPPIADRIEESLIARYESDGVGMLPPSIQRMAVDPFRASRLVIFRPIMSFEVTPQAIAQRVDELFDQDISDASQEGRAWAEERSFEALRGRWLEEIAA